MSDLIVFSTPRYAPLADAIARDGGYQRGLVEHSRFPDGERYMRIMTNVDGRDVVIVGGTIDDLHTLEMFDLGSAAVHYGARRLSLVVPYFGYSTMDRAIRAGEVVTAKTRAHLLSSIPDAAYGNRIFLVDLHTEGLPHYFDGGVRTVHVYAKPVIADAVRSLGGPDFVLACTDAGRAKWVESLANDLGVTASFVFKRRLDGEKTEITAVSAQVEGKRVIIYDDMIRTGGSLLSAAAAYRAAGATSIAAVATHGIFPGDTLSKIEARGLLERIIVTDTHPNAVELASAFLEVRPVAVVIGGALRRSM